MVAYIIDGKAIAAAIRAETARQVEVLVRDYNLIPGLAVVRVGEDPASEVYVRNKVRSTQEVGMHSWEHHLPADVSQETLLRKLDKLNEDHAVHGILVQLPLPSHISEEAVIKHIRVEKDVDGFHIENAGKLMTGQEGLFPCTPVGCVMLAKHCFQHRSQGDLSGLHAVVVGRSNIVGKPLSLLLLRENCTVTIAHSRTAHLPELCRTADILVAAVGRPQMIKGDWVKPGAVVIDVGINRIPGEGGKTRLVGDVDFESAKEVAAAITPVPGGVGPMTIACLLANTVKAACLQRSVDYGTL
ncbi:MAG: bifunctional methylenetetrahydrofolate dehydrogenase/methenyltetrahydrofolate cyclohydrolase FolD [Alphaproteobacteria bacterium]|nr:bifunctional methylenetetrahydrofolate dehydrogenase/methenyltetrahydrofolate cyclohydrolase FolD [Alphaproteobacteria bacterium]